VEWAPGQRFARGPHARSLGGSGSTGHASKWGGIGFELPSVERHACDASLKF